MCGQVDLCSEPLKLVACLHAQNHLESHGVGAQGLVAFSRPILPWGPLMGPFLLISLTLQKVFLSEEMLPFSLAVATFCWEFPGPAQGCSCHRRAFPHLCALEQEMILEAPFWKRFPG